MRFAKDFNTLNRFGGPSGAKTCMSTMNVRNRNDGV